MGCIPLSSSVHAILLARTMEWVAMPLSRDWAHISYVSGIGSRLPVASPGIPKVVLRPTNFDTPYFVFIRFNLFIDFLWDFLFDPQITKLWFNSIFFSFQGFGGFPVIYYQSLIWFLYGLRTHCDFSSFTFSDIDFIA